VRILRKCAGTQSRSTGAGIVQRGDQRAEIACRGATSARTIPAADKSMSRRIDAPDGQQFDMGESYFFTYGMSFADLR
jgi:hypothetical protein